MPNNPDSVAEELADDTKLLASSLGGPRGMFESGAPSLVFVATYALSKNNLQISIYSAITIGILLGIYRVVKRQTLSQITAGFIGLGFSAWLATRSGNAEDFFLPGIITNFIYASICLISLIINRPILGFVIESIKSSNSKWQQNQNLVKRYRTMTYLWFAVFMIRVLVMAPLYLANQTVLLGFFKLALGWPLFAFSAYATYALNKKN